MGVLVAHDLWGVAHYSSVGWTSAKDGQLAPLGTPVSHAQDLHHRTRCHGWLVLGYLPLLLGHCGHPCVLVDWWKAYFRQIGDYFLTVGRFLLGNCRAYYVLFVG